MPASATELNGEVPATLLLSQVQRLFGNRDSRPKGQDATMDVA